MMLFGKHTTAQVVRTQTLSTGLLFPVGIHNSGIPGDDRLFILEKRGRIKIVDRVTGSVMARPFLDIYSKVYPVIGGSDERGLLGMAFHPDYATNGFFFLNYIKPSGHTVISRFQVSSDPDSADHNSEVILMTIRQPFANHNGGNLMFGRDGYLYISLGDGGSSGDPGNRAQNADSLLGKILRIDVNHPVTPFYLSVPSNPFYGATPGRDEIFDTGLRNPWRCSFDRLTGDCWIADVGQNQVEEINFRSICDTNGQNYGWRCYEGSQAYNTAGCSAPSQYRSPVFEYPHAQGCSVTGGYVYRGAREGSLFGRYLFTDFCQGRIWSTTHDSAGTFNTTTLTLASTQINMNFSSWGEDIDGELYLAALAVGRIYRLRDTACAPTAYIKAPDTLYSCSPQVTLTAIHGQGLTYSWTISGAGTWSVHSGQGTSSLVIVPDGSTPANICVTVANGTCSAVSKTITVIASAVMSGLSNAYCNDASSVVLSLWPPGGKLSGPGAGNVSFSPVAAGSGTHTLLYSVADTISSCYYRASGCVLTASRTVAVEVCSGGEASDRDIARVYPNPVDDRLRIEFTKGTFNGEIVFTDATGRRVLVPQVSGGGTLEFDTSRLAAGVYLVTIRGEGGISNARVVVYK